MCLLSGVSCASGPASAGPEDFLGAEAVWVLGPADADHEISAADARQLLNAPATWQPTSAVRLGAVLDRGGRGVLGHQRCVVSPEDALGLATIRAHAVSPLLGVLREHLGHRFTYA